MFMQWGLPFIAAFGLATLIWLGFEWVDGKLDRITELETANSELKLGSESLQRQLNQRNTEFETQKRLISNLQSQLNESERRFNARMREIEGINYDLLAQENLEALREIVERQERELFERLNSFGTEDTNNVPPAG